MFHAARALFQRAVTCAQLQAIVYLSMRQFLERESRHAVNCPTYLVVDVRSTDECNDTGMIPTAINVPLELVDGVFCDGTDDYFLRNFGIAKPEADETQLVFYCRGGVRSRRAAFIADALGYTAMHFPGGWKEWSVQRGAGGTQFPEE